MVMMERYLHRKQACRCLPKQGGQRRDAHSCQMPLSVKSEEKYRPFDPCQWVRQVLCFAMVLLATFLGACDSRATRQEEGVAFDEVLPEPDPPKRSPLVGCWISPQDPTGSKLCISEDSVLFYDLLMTYPYYAVGDSLIVTSSGGEAFIRWRFVRQNDTLLLFQRPEGGSEEYVVLMTLSSE